MLAAPSTDCPGSVTNASCCRQHRPMTCSSAKHLLHLLISQEIAEALNHEQAIMSARHEQVKAAASHLLHSRIDYYALTIQQADPHACHSLCERYICMHSDTELVML